MAGVGDEHSHRDHISQGATGFLEGLTESGKYLTDLPVKIAGKRFAGRICRADLPNTKLRSSKYLNNLIEQDHRGVKQRIAPRRRGHRDTDAEAAARSAHRVWFRSITQLWHEHGDHSIDGLFSWRRRSSIRASSSGRRTGYAERCSASQRRVAATT